MRGWLIQICLIAPLLFAISCSGDEFCTNFWGHSGVTRNCRNSFCCGTLDYRYCCESCKLRYPPVDCPVPGTENDYSNTSTMSALSSMQITWLVVGFILLLKGIIAVIYLCCCRNPSRRSRPSRTRTTDMECGPSPTHVPYDPSGPGAPPSYEDLVKDGVLNPAYDRENCEQRGTTSGLAAPPIPPTSGIPPPPYSAVIPQTSSAAVSQAVPGQESGPEVPR